eukprot:TRINITY_DN20301_c0_g1_i1.p1 TRINITY_DN20301_c0_g1~~TRINITY_DN20301_c0_g1_i1.p1  ORF type:complete len:349 (+),score=39.32 TRINITY_DN20301_c0_g1_i1:102-1148(+)
MVSMVWYVRLCWLAVLVDGVHLKGTRRLGFETLVHDGAEKLDAPNIVFTHLLKAGGTTVDAELAKILVATDDPRGYVRQSSVFSIDPQTLADSLGRVKKELTPAGSTGFAVYHSPDFFRIGNVRNPCDYLLSMWAFQSSPYGDSTGHGKIPHQCMAKTLSLRGNSEAEPEELYGKDMDGHFSSDDDIKRFRQWVRASAGSKVHYLSYRSYLAAQVDPYTSPLPIWDDGQYLGCLGQLNATEEAHIAETLAAMDLSDRYDCLIHTETLQDDLRSCMMQYAQRVEDTQKREILVKKIAAVTDVMGTSNRGQHGTCEQYFDSDTAAFVWAREGDFASKVGYSKCCGRPSSR